MGIIGHRGLAASHPDNTLRAFRQASQECDWVELDVRLSADDIPVVVHDADLSRISDGDAQIRDCTASQLAAVDVLGSGEGIPRLEACLSAINVPVVVHLKVLEGIDRVSELLESCENELMVQSFSPQVVTTVADRVPVGLLCPPAEQLPAIAEHGSAIRSVEQATTFMNDCNGAAVNLHQSLCDAETVESLQAQGFTVFGWTVRTESDGIHMHDAGVDGAICCHSVCNLGWSPLLLFATARLTSDTGFGIMVPTQGRCVRVHTVSQVE